MAFLRKKDYYHLIQSDNLDVVTGSDDTLISETERVSQSEIESYLRHRYLVNQIFINIQAFAIGTAYKVNDLVEWTETAWVIGTTYTTGLRVSYDGKIYSSLQNANIGKQPDTEPTWWDELADNESLWYVRQDTTGNLPTSAYAFTANAYTGNHGDIKGWDKTKTIYLKKFSDDTIRMYHTTDDRTNDTNTVGIFNYDPTSLEFPKTVDICAGASKDNILGGSIDITSFIADDTEWNVVASNYFTLGDNRNQQIKTYMIDITLYHLHSRINPRNVPDFRIARRDDAIGWLKMISKGQITADLPVYTDTDKGQNTIYGSNEKLTHSY